LLLPNDISLCRQNKDYHNGTKDSGIDEKDCPKDPVLHHAQD